MQPVLQLLHAVAAMVNLGWEHDWNLDLQFDSPVSSFCALGFVLIMGTRDSHHQPDEAKGPQLLLKVCGRNGLLQGVGQSGHESVERQQGGYPLQRLWRENNIGSSCKYSLKSFIFCFGNVKEIWKGYVPKLHSSCIPILVYPISYHVSEGTWIKLVVVKRAFC